VASATERGSFGVLCYGLGFQIELLSRFGLNGTIAKYIMQSLISYMSCGSVVLRFSARTKWMAVQIFSKHFPLIFQYYKVWRSRSLATAGMRHSNSSQGKIIPDFLLRELPKAGLDPPSDWSDTVFWCWNSDDTNLNRLFRHLAFEAFLEREKRSVDGVFQRYIIVVSVSNERDIRGGLFEANTERPRRQPGNPPLNWQSVLQVGQEDEMRHESAKHGGQVR
jgi:hypothetical protein